MGVLRVAPSVVATVFRDYIVISDIVFCVIDLFYGHFVDNLLIAL